MDRRERILERRIRRHRRVFVVSLVSVLVVVASVGVAAYEPWAPAGERDRKVEAGGRRSEPTTTTTAPVVVGIRNRLIAEENERPGTVDWRHTDIGEPGDIEGYASVTSAAQGQKVTMYVSTTSPAFRVEAYRMGWYQGLGGRHVWTSPDAPGKVQAEPTVAPDTWLVEARWEPSLEFVPDASWPPGTYILKLVASEGPQQWVPLTIRDDTSRAAFVVMNAVTTWQAYNIWGGCSLYSCPNEGGDRAKIVSFDRPYDRRSGGAADFIGNEMPLVMEMERLGLDVTYITNIDLHERPDRLLQHKAMFSLGHDEYWSKAMYDGAERARDAGVNLAFLGANAVYRQIRLEPSDTGPNRREVNYRSRNDPVADERPEETTVSWREAPVNRSEARLIGQQYECNPVDDDFVITDPGAWVYFGTGVTAGTRIPGLVGSEYDRFVPGQGAPDNVQILAHSPVNCRGRSSWANMTYYTAPSGAGVLSTGTNLWVNKLSPPGWPDGVHDGLVTRIMHNVFEVFGAGPAGQRHPSVPNWQGLPGIE